MTNVWIAEVERDRDLCALPPILPVVVHHCDRAWSIDPEFSALVECAGVAELLASTPKFRTILADLHVVDSEDLRSGPGSAAVRATLLALKETRSAASLEQLLFGMARLLNQLEWEPDGGDVIDLLIRYILGVRGAEEFLGIDVQRLGLGKTSEAIMETREAYLLRKGGEAGVGGVVLNLLRNKFSQVSPEVVARVESADLESLNRWALRVLVAASVDEVFDATH